MEFSSLFARYGTAALRLLPAELAHELGLKLLRSRMIDYMPKPSANELLLDSADRLSLKVNVPGIGSLKHPIGLAAGFDKNCYTPEGFMKLGFSFLEIGTVTPRPQQGNPKPRLFRYPEQRAIINRMGFNSDGADVVKTNLKDCRWNHDVVPLGVNVGKNKTTPEELALDDFVGVIEKFWGMAKYYVVNVSSPNTPGLRSLANTSFIQTLSTELKDKVGKVWVKLDPDLDKKDFQKNVEAIVECGFQGIILTNTHRVEKPQAGGLSGHPLSVMSTVKLEHAHEVTEGKLPIVAVGGILSGHDVYQKIIRGALAVQIYTALVYRGPWAVHYLLKELEDELKLNGFDNLQDAIGSYYLGGS